MQEDKNIDKLFREGLKGRTAAGNAESSWSEASAMLDQHFAKGGWFSWTKAAGLLLLISASVLGVWLYPFNDGAGTKVPESTVVESKESSIPSTQNESMMIDGAAKARSSSKSSVAEAPETPSAVPAASSAKERPATETTTSDDLDQPVAAASHNSKVSVPNTTTSDETDADARLPESTSNASSTSSSSLDPRQTDSYSTSSAMSQTLEAATIALKEMKAMPPFEVGAFNLHTSGIADRDPLKKAALMTELQKVEVMLEGGVLGASGFTNTGAGGFQLGLGWMGGIAVQYHFHNKLFARSGALLHTRDALNSNSLEAQRFDGILEAVPMRITYVDIPLEVGYRSNRHSLHFGLLFSPLISARTALEFTPNNADTEAESNIETYERRREGFASFDVAGSAGYRFQVSERMNVFGNLRFGLFDLTDNAYFGTALVDDRNHQLRFGLSYRILHL
jgi:hypothetical protein